MTDTHIGAIILAAGQGKRMNLSEGNKVTLTLGDRPIVLRIVQFMKQILLQTIVVVVGHEKESVKNTLKNESVLFAEQEERLGTGHAVTCALTVLPDEITDVVVVYGDDAVLYTDSQAPIVRNLITTHSSSDAVMSFLTIEQENPFGLGRVVRDEKGEVVEIVEEKDATEEQKMITEVNPGCFIFKVSFLKKYLPLVEKSPATGEYYLTSLIDIAMKNKEKITTVKGGKLAWRGVNTPEELQAAEKLLGGN